MEDQCSNESELNSTQNGITSFPLMACVSDAPIDDLRRIVNDMWTLKQAPHPNVMCPLRISLVEKGPSTGDLVVVLDVNSDEILPLSSLLTNRHPDFQIITSDCRSFTPLGRTLFEGLFNALHHLSTLRIRHLLICPSNVFIVWRANRVPVLCLGPLIGRASYRFALAAAACPRPTHGTSPKPKKDKLEPTPVIYESGHPQMRLPVETIPIGVGPYITGRRNSATSEVSLLNSNTIMTMENDGSSYVNYPKYMTSDNHSNTINVSNSGNDQVAAAAALLPTFEGVDSLEAVLPWCAPELQKLLVGDASWRQLASPLLKARVADKGRVPAVLEQLRAADLWSMGLVMAEIVLREIEFIKNPEKHEEAKETFEFPSLLGDSLENALTQAQKGVLPKLPELPPMIAAFLSEVCQVRARDRASPALASCHMMFWSAELSGQFLDDCDKLISACEKVHDQFKIRIAHTLVGALSPPHPQSPEKRKIARSTSYDEFVPGAADSEDLTTVPENAVTNLETSLYQKDLASFDLQLSATLTHLRSLLDSVQPFLNVYRNRKMGNSPQNQQFLNEKNDAAAEDDFAKNSYNQTDETKDNNTDEDVSLELLEEKYSECLEEVSIFYFTLQALTLHAITPEISCTPPPPANKAAFALLPPSLRTAHSSSSPAPPAYNALCKALRSCWEKNAGDTVAGLGYQPEIWNLAVTLFPQRNHAESKEMGESIMQQLHASRKSGQLFSSIVADTRKFMRSSVSTLPGAFEESSMYEGEMVEDSGDGAKLNSNMLRTPVERKKGHLGDPSSYAASSTRVPTTIRAARSPATRVHVNIPMPPTIPNLGPDFDDQPPDTQAYPYMRRDTRPLLPDTPHKPIHPEWGASFGRQVKLGSTTGKYFLNF